MAVRTDDEAAGWYIRAPMNPALSPSTFVLVHGAWQGGWVWRATADLLTAQGSRVFTPTLTGLGERADLLDKSVDLSRHIDDICRLIEDENLRDIVLAGHSYGGMVVSGAADRMPERVKSLVILDGFVPEDGKAMRDYWPPASMKYLEKQAELSGGVSVPPISAELLAVDKANREWVDRNATPQPFATFNEVIRLTGGRKSIARKTYIRATRFRSHSFDATLKRLQADGNWKTVEMDCGHEAMVDRPRELAELFEEAA